MNTYLNFEQGEISIYLAGDALANLRCSLEQAEAIRLDKQRGAVLYVNTSFTTRKFRSSWREIIGGGMDSRLRGNDNEGMDSRLRGNDKEGMDSRLPGNDSGGIYSLDCPIGELLWHFEDMKEMVRKYHIRQIIINNWEYAYKDYRQKEEAIFRLHEFLNMDVSLVVYAQANPEKAKAGKIMHGGLGKLSGLAVDVVDLIKDRANAEKEFEEISENVNLDAMQINELDMAQVPLIQQEQEETGGSVFSVNETGLISHTKTKHLPMSNKNRKLLTEYEKLHGKTQIPGESYRDMFDRVVGKMLAEKAGMGLREMAGA